ncbi:efflux RND transporter periplasmic adaptor subunit [Brevundimonas sp.]|uniref:efflux RND transporter periplasmic adaptor subunit n=1 Tax=Brevundimonas sp. TaxID=1871086 RepID=UPI00391C1742
MPFALPASLKQTWLAGRTGRVVLAVVGLIVVGTLAWWLFLRPEPAPDVMLATARLGDIEEVVLATGKLEPLELISVGAQVSGRVERLAVEVGDVVRPGQIIAEIDSQTQQNTLRDRQAALANVRASRASRAATLAQAERDLARQQQMLEADATPRAQYDSALGTVEAARAEVQALDAQIEQAQAAVDSARVELGYTRITAPIGGTIVSVVTDEGQTVNAMQTAPTIVMIAQLDTMTVRTEISEADVIRVDAGMSAYFTILGDSRRRFEGVLRQVEPAPESIANDTATSTTSEAIYYMGLIDVDNADGVLRPSMTAQVSIVMDRAQGAVLIPITALGQEISAGVHIVRVREGDGRIRDRQVQTGINDGSNVQVLSGLSQGEQVVVGEGGGDIPSGMPQPPGGLAAGMGGPPGGGGPR